ncbi:hypothetical protein AB0D83_23475 [Streptomyces decoyicus]|uniref:hypothetical protein n=1 Tax=Streptomyces decoyicus TaxID=249567 RepID=UPI0033CEA353
MGAAAGFGGTDLDVLMRVTAACLAAVTLAGLGAALVLLPRRTPLWCGVCASTLLTAAVPAFSGWPVAARPEPVGVAGQAVGQQPHLGPRHRQHPLVHVADALRAPFRTWPAPLPRRF